MPGLSIKDVLKVAIQMEEDGKTFYQYAAAIVKDDNVKQVMSALADEEIMHRHVFEDMLNAAPDDIVIADDKSSYFEFLKNHMDSRSVFDRKKFEEEEDRVKSIETAINFAIDREMEAVVYYTGILNLVKEQHEALVQKIIGEESTHFMKLSKAKGMLSK